MTLTAVLFVCLLALSGTNGADITSTTPAAEKPSKPVECTEPFSHYKELGCKPIYSEKNPTCAERYDCPFVKDPVDSKKCVYKGKEYENGQQIDSNINDHKCSVECSCHEQYNGVMSFMCAEVECPEDYEGPVPNKCVKQYETDSCCSHNEICDESAIKALSTCTWDSTEYKEGQRFYPDNTCLHCVCSKDFNGTLDGPWCDTINCGAELYHAKDVHTMCAPIYLESRNCCPIEWTCSSGQDKIEEIASVKSGNPDMKCHFGNQTLEIGDKVANSDKCVTCSCKVPPLVSCTRALDC